MLIYLDKESAIEVKVLIEYALKYLYTEKFNVILNQVLNQINEGLKDYKEGTTK